MRRPETPEVQSAEVSIEQRRAENAALDADPVPAPAPFKGSALSEEQRRALDEARKSADYLEQFKAACIDLLPKITNAAERMDALAYVQAVLERIREETKLKRRAA